METQAEDQLKSQVYIIFWCSKLNHKDMDLISENEVFQVIGNIDCYIQLGQDITYATTLNLFNFIYHKYLHKIEKCI